MPTNTLTDNDCRKAKPREKAYKLFDGGGLYLWISPKGAKTWRQAYREHGKPQTATHGEYPLVSLADARVKRDDLKKRLIAGESPKLPRSSAGSLTLQQASETYWNGRKDLSDSYRDNALRGLELHLAKLWSRPLGAITRDDLLQHLLATDAAGRHVYVRKVRMWAGQVFEWGVEHRHCRGNPAALINPKRAFGHAKVEHFAALKLGEVLPLMARVDMEGELLSVLATWLLALTWTRTNELRFMEWDEIDWRKELWEIPEGKMKRRRAHLVPLSKPAQEILRKLQARRRGSKYVFPAEHRDDRPMSENTILALLYRLGYKGTMTGHGFRSVASTWANEHQYNADAIERQLAHVPDDKIRGIYNKAEYLPLRREILQAWADWLEGARASGEGAPPAADAIAA